MEKILPVLKPATEFKLQSERGMYLHKLMDFDNSPFVMFGEDMGHAVAYTPNLSLAENEKTKDTALRNLRALNVNLSFESLQGMKIAIAQHEYAAEKIIDTDFLQQISNQLDSEEIVIGIPVKGFFAAVPRESNLLKFGAVIEKYFQNPQDTYGISDYLFVAENGTITNAAKGVKNTQPEKPWWKVW